MHFDIDKTREIIESANIDTQCKEIIIMRFGLDGNPPAEIRSIGKRFGLKGKKLADAINKSDKLAYNILKSEHIYDIIIQISNDGEGNQ